jgi:hypothetical protein
MTKTKIQASTAISSPCRHQNRNLRAILGQTRSWATLFWPLLLECDCGAIALARWRTSQKRCFLRCDLTFCYFGAPARPFHASAANSLRTRPTASQSIPRVLLTTKYLCLAGNYLLEKVIPSGRWELFSQEIETPEKWRANRASPRDPGMG